MTTYYVTTSGSDSNNGLTEGTAFATPGYAASQATIGGDIVYVKEGTYTLTTTTENVSGGTIGIARAVKFLGYKTTAGDFAARPIINAGSQVVTNVIRIVSPNFNNQGSAVRCIEVDGSNNATTGFNAAGTFSSLVENCIARNCSNGFYGGGYGQSFTNCSAIDCTTSGFDYGYCVYCHAHSCLRGFTGITRYLFGCIASNATNEGFSVGNTYPYLWNRCVAVNNGSDGFKDEYAIGQLNQCIASGNGGYGFRVGANGSLMTDCADYSNASGRDIIVSNPLDIRPINLTADPFTSASTGDFTLTNDAGGGAELRQIQLSGLAGVNGVFDVGAIDAVVTSGGGGATVHPLYAN
jgi:hypothetical protein